MLEFKFWEKIREAVDTAEKLVIVCGSNDLTNREKEVQQSAMEALVKAFSYLFIRRVQGKFEKEGVCVVVLPLPRNYTNYSEQEKFIRFNEILGTMMKELVYHYGGAFGVVDIARKLLDSKARVFRDDGVHLNQEGKTILEREIKERIEKIESKGKKGV